MDEKRTESTPVNETDPERNETTAPSRTADPSSPDGAPDSGWSFVTQAQYDPDEPHDLTTVIIGAIAEAEDVPIVEIQNPPLYDVVDIASLESVLFDRPRGNGTASTVEFHYNQYKVSVESDGWVTVADRSEGLGTD